MIEDFMSVLEDYHNANLHSEAARRTIAEALVKHMCDHHIITYTNLERHNEQMNQSAEGGL